MTAPPPMLRANGLLEGEMAVDLFAGGGGTSSGIDAALLRPPDIAVNHSAIAVRMHELNHPETRHFIEDVWAVDPRTAAAGRRVGLLWASPDCTQFSKAKGGRPVSKGIRGLAWVVIHWLEDVRPRLVLCENVEEFEGWGPLDAEGRPDKSRKGETFRAWIARFIDLGYAVEWRVLSAADFGSPTRRKRLFVVARCDGKPIVWPEPTHGPGRARSWRFASEIIDWSDPGRSIFGRPKPLAEATLSRIAAGIEKYVVKNPHPYLIKFHGGDRGHTRVQTCDQPLRTLDTSNRFGLVQPVLVGSHLMPVTHQGDERIHGLDETVRTVTGAHRGELALVEGVVEPFIVRHGHYSTITGAGLREGCGAGTFRGQPLNQPLATICGTEDKHLCMPWVVKAYGGGPAGVQTPGSSMRDPLGTVTANDHNWLAAAHLEKLYGSARSGCSAEEPMPTITASGKGGGHVAAVQSLLIKFYGSKKGQHQSIHEPLHTVVSKDRFGLVTVGSTPYRIADILLRMLKSRELFNAQGFEPDYIIDFDWNGKPVTKTAQVSLAGNSVCPQMAHALVRANTWGS